MVSLLKTGAPVAKTHRSPGRLRQVLLLGTLGVTSVAGLVSTYARSRPAPLPAPPAPTSEPQIDPQDRLGGALCALKDSVRYRTARWTPAICREIAGYVLAAANKHRLSPALILAVMLNESDLDEKANARYQRGGKFYAQDSGLMGIRCVYDRRGRCANGRVRGLRPRDLFNPRTNIDLGAEELAANRDGSGVEKRIVKDRLPGGEIATRTKLVRCKHRSHAYWAHYNHGSFYISRGSARHYPHRVGVLYHALAESLDLPREPALDGPITVRDPGRRPRTADRPVEPRFRVLCDKIYQAARATAPTLALASSPRQG